MVGENRGEANYYDFKSFIFFLNFDKIWLERGKYCFGWACSPVCCGRDGHEGLISFILCEENLSHDFNQGRTETKGGQGQTV